MPSEPRRASVAIILRVVPSPHGPQPQPQATPPSLSEFFQLDWVNDPNARPEVLFLQRDSPHPVDTPMTNARPKSSEAHVAFPGGRTEPDDEGGLYTGMLPLSYSILPFFFFYPQFIALRQTWEEIGIDLAERNYMNIGQLDDREITTSLGKRLLMILSPYVFLQVTPHAATPDPAPSSTLYWIPLASFVSPHTPPKWSTVTVDAASRLAPKHSTALRLLVRILVGSMEFPAIVLDASPPTPPISSSDLKNGPPGAIPTRPKVLKLWGLSLGMALDLMSYMIIPLATTSDGKRTPATGSQASRANTPLSPIMHIPYQNTDDPERFRMEVVAPSLASVFPRFSYPDVNFWIW